MTEIVVEAYSTPSVLHIMSNTFCCVFYKIDENRLFLRFLFFSKSAIFLSTIMPGANSAVTGQPHDVQEASKPSAVDSKFLMSFPFYNLNLHISLS